MKKILFALAATASSALLAGAQETLIWYDRPAEYFEEALVIGNGTLGGIIYGGANVDKISLNDITLWTGEPEGKPYSPDAYKAIPAIRLALDNGEYAKADSLQLAVQGHFSQNYQPLGQLMIEFADTLDSPDSYKRWLDIGTAVAGKKLKRGDYTYHTEYFASNPDQGIVIRITTDNPAGAKVNLSLSSQLRHEITVDGDDIVMDGYAGYASLPSYYDADEKFAYDPDRGIHFRTRVKKVENGPETLIYIVNATSFNGFDKDPVREGCPYKEIADSRMEQISSLTYDQLSQRHADDYQPIFNRVSLNLAPDGALHCDMPTDKRLLAYLDEDLFDPGFEALYFQFGRYLLISCSRTPNVPANLQGLWNESILPPWSCNYTSNINLEENYWPAEIANLTEMHMPMLSFLKELQVAGKETAKAYYGIDNGGWCLAHNTDIWAMTNPVGLNTGDPCWANWNMGGAWASTHIWEHYMFSLDKEFLAEHYPALKGAALFCLDWMVERDGQLMTSPATSPENVFVTDDGYHGRSCYGGSADIAMIRECLVDTRNAALELGVDKDLAARIDDALSRLMPYKIGKKGNIQEWYYDWEDEDPHHRHQSHLYGLFPGHNLADGHNSEADLRKAASRTLELKGDKTTGWSTGWRVNLFARLGEADKAYHIYRKLLSYISPDKYKGSDKRKGGGTYPNLLDAHQPFQIDGNFGGTAGVIEMLMQSEYASEESGVTASDGSIIPVILLLPALPANWKDGSVSGIRARGGYTVDMEWNDGKVERLAITAQRPGPAKVRVNGRLITLQLKQGANKFAFKTK